jgi:hypothetical protein
MAWCIHGPHSVWLMGTHQHQEARSTSARDNLRSARITRTTEQCCLVVMCTPDTASLSANHTTCCENKTCKKSDLEHTYKLLYSHLPIFFSHHVNIFHTTKNFDSHGEPFLFTQTIFVFTPKERVLFIGTQFSILYTSMINDRSHLTTAPFQADLNPKPGQNDKCPALGRPLKHN